ncbi:MFS transporter [Thermodesulfobacteriota bacterium]
MRKIFYGWWVVFACFFIYFYISSTVFSFTAFFKPISKEFGWSYTQISIAASIRSLEQGIFAPIMGFLVDRFGARKLIFCGTLFIGIGFIMASQINSLIMFYGAFVVIALGMSACVGTVLTAAVANWFKKDLSKALGIISAGIGAGGLFVPIIISLINYYQWRTTFTIIGFGMLLFGIPLSLLVRHSPEQYGYLPDGITPEKQAASPDDHDREVNIKEALKNRVFWHLSFAEAIRRMTTIAIITHVMPYLNNVGMSRSRAALVTASIPVFSIIGRLVFGWFGDIYNKSHAMALVYFITGVSLLAFAYAQTTWLIIPFLIFFPLSWGAQPLKGAIIREYFGRRSLGSIIGLMAGIGSIATIIGPSLAGWTYDTFGNYRMIWLFFAATFSIAVILMLTIKPLQKFAKMG